MENMVLPGLIILSGTGDLKFLNNTEITGQNKFKIETFETTEIPPLSVNITLSVKNLTVEAYYSLQPPISVLGLFTIHSQGRSRFYLEGVIAKISCKIEELNTTETGTQEYRIKEISDIGFKTDSANVNLEGIMSNDFISKVSSGILSRFAAPLINRYFGNLLIQYREEIAGILNRLLSLPTNFHWNETRTNKK